MSVFDLVGRKRPLVMLISATVSLCGCQESKSVDEEARSLDYYAQHLSEAKSTVESCALNGHAGADCTNAGAAVTQSLRAASREKRDETSKAVKDGSIFPKWNGK